MINENKQIASLENSLSDITQVKSVVGIDLGGSSSYATLRATEDDIELRFVKTFLTKSLDDLIETTVSFVERAYDIDKISDVFVEGEKPYYGSRDKIYFIRDARNELQKYTPGLLKDVDSGKISLADAVDKMVKFRREHAITQVDRISAVDRALRNIDIVKDGKVNINFPSPYDISFFFVGQRMSSKQKSRQHLGVVFHWLMEDSRVDTNHDVDSIRAALFGLRDCQFVLERTQEFKPQVPGYNDTKTDEASDGRSRQKQDLIRRKIELMELSSVNTDKEHSIRTSVVEDTLYFDELEPIIRGLEILEERRRIESELRKLYQSD